MKLKILFLVLVLSNSFLLKAQIRDEITYYSQALEYLKGESSIGKPDKRYNKLRVTPQVVNFDILGWYLKSEVSKRSPSYVPKSMFSDNDYNPSESLANLTCDIKKSKYQLFFSEIKGDLLLAEVIKESKSSDYRSATMFGEGIVFLFEFADGKLNNVTSEYIYHN